MQAESEDGQSVPHSAIARSVRHNWTLSGNPYKGIPPRTAQRVSPAHTGLRYGKYPPQEDCKALWHYKNMARHTFASQMTLSEGVAIESVSKMLGHSQIKTTQVYAETSPERVFRDVEKILPFIAQYRLTN